MPEDGWSRNRNRLERAYNDADSWAPEAEPEEARERIDAFLWQALVAQADPVTFAAIVRRAEIFAGKP